MATYRVRLRTDAEITDTHHTLRLRVEIGLPEGAPVDWKPIGILDFAKEADETMQQAAARFNQEVQAFIARWESEQQLTTLVSTFLADKTWTT